MANTYPCDNPDSYCPFNAVGGYDCRNFCGLGVDEDEEEYEDVNDDDVKNMLKDLYLRDAKEWYRDAKDYHRMALKAIKSNKNATFYKKMEQKAIKFANVLECLAKEID